MTRMTRIILLTLLAAPLSAQVWSPHPRYASEMGQAPAVDWGHSLASRYQFVDGNFRGQPLVLGKISARATSEFYSESNGLGRTWQQVDIDIGPADLANIGQTYSNNYLAAPTQVYSGTMRWPNLQGVIPKVINHYPVSIPLSVPYMHTGVHDFAIDVRMSGGKFDPSSAPGRHNYHLNTYAVRNNEAGVPHYYHDSSTSGCVDSSLPSASPRASSEMVVVRYADEPFLPSHVRNIVFPRALAEGLPPRTTFINVLGLSGIPTGIPLGAGCERLYVDLTKFNVLRSGRTDAVGEASAWWSHTGFVFHPVMTNLELFTQFAWQDTSTASLKLTAASSAAVPELRYTSDQAARRVAVYGPFGGTVGSISWSSWFNPIFKYE